MARTAGTLFDSTLVGGGLESAPVNVTAAYVMASTDNWVRCTQSAAYAVTLPSVASVPLGTVVVVSKVDTSAFAVTLTGAGSDLINGSATNAALLASGSRAVARLRAAAANTWDVV